MKDSKSTLQISKDLLKLAVPNSITYFIQNLIDPITLYFIGNLGHNDYTGFVGLGNSWYIISSYSILLGISSTVDTFVSQMYGQKKLRDCGTYFYRAAILTFILCIPFSLLLIYGSIFLRFVGIDKQTADSASHFATYLIPYLFLSTQYELLLRFLNAQQIAAPVTLITIITTIAHPIWCSLFINDLNFGYLGAALAKAFTCAISLQLLWFYIIKTNCCQFTLGPIVLSEVFKDLKGFASVALPGALMSCLDCWAFELVSLIAGTIGSEELSVSVSLSQINLLFFMIPVGLGRSACTFIGNNFGAKNYHAYRLYTMVGFLLNLILVSFSSLIFVIFRRQIGTYFFKDEGMVTLFSQAALILAAMILYDSTQGYFARVALGMKMQSEATLAVIGAYYVVMLPAAYYFIWVLKKGLFGLWGANFLAAASLALFYGFFIWRKLKPIYTKLD